MSATRTAESLERALRKRQRELGKAVEACERPAPASVPAAETSGRRSRPGPSARLRVGQAVALSAEDVDLERRVIHVRSSKTDSGLRTVPIVDELGVVLLGWLDGLRSRPSWRPDMPLLATCHATPMKEQFAWRLVKRAAHRAGVRTTGTGPLASAVTPHTLRRTYASDLINRKVPLEHVSKILGHADVRVTQQAYADLEDATAHASIRAALAS